MTSAEQDKEDAEGCLIMIRDFLTEIGCKCGKNTHKSTPAMMYPEWIACALTAYGEKMKGKERARCMGILNEAIGQAKGKAWYHPEFNLQVLVGAMATTPTEGEDRNLKEA